MYRDHHNENNINNNITYNTVITFKLEYQIIGIILIIPALKNLNTLHDHVRYVSHYEEKA